MVLRISGDFRMVSELSYPFMTVTITKFSASRKTHVRVLYCLRALLIGRRYLVTTIRTLKNAVCLWYLSTKAWG